MAFVRGELIIAAGGLYEYLQALGGEDGGGAPGYTYYHALHTFDGADVAAAKAALARDFAVVGVTEVMSGFLALLALEMRWPVRALCYVDFHRNAARPRRADFGADVVAALDAALAQEREVYDHARALYDAHARRRTARATTSSTSSSRASSTSPRACSRRSRSATASHPSPRGRGTGAATRTASRESAGTERVKGPTNRLTWIEDALFRCPAP